MSKKKKLCAILVVPLLVICLLVWYLSNHSIAVLDPAGQISRQERQLMLFAILLSAIVVLPVYGLTIMIALKYRESNKTAKYSPDWDHGKRYEITWWAIPIVIVSVLAVITWRSSHSLDPYRTIASKTPAINVQVVALDWKWLFIYPNNHVASVNQLDIPLNTPVNLYITSDTVMNSLWIPNLAGQIYAMPGMETQLHIIADKQGSYYGSSANISGKGFAGMHFMTNAVPQSNYDDWLASLNSSPNTLNFQGYKQLAEPSVNNSVAYYSKVSNNLFNYVILKYMDPTLPGATNV